MRFVDHLRLVRGQPPEWLVHDEPMPCPYLPGQTARLPMRLPLRPLSPDELAQRLHGGDRRQGAFLYQPSCPTCRACEAIRIDVEAFAPRKTQRRVFRRGESLLQTEVGRPTLTAEKVALYNRHKLDRDLCRGDGLIDPGGYEQFLVDSCADTIELTYRCRGALVGVAIADRAADALSAVYCFYDPAYARLSPGVYSILKQVALCQEWQLRYLYLGLYIADCSPMAYKTQFLPHQRRINGAWQPFGCSGDRTRG